MNRTLTVALVLSLLLALSRCQNQQEPDHAVIATLGDGTLTLADFDEFLLAHAPENRVPPQGESAAAWIEDKIRRLAIERHFSQSEAMATLLASPGIEAQTLLNRFQQLGQALQQQLLAEVTPSEAAIEARIATLKASLATEPVYDLQHIFLRTDLGDAAAAKAKAQAVLDQARAGGDFTELVRKHSASANAQEDGFIRNVYLANLDKPVADQLENLAEGQISDLIESRTGIHLFRLIRRVEPRPPSEPQLRKRAVQNLQRGLFPQHLSALREALEQRIPTNTEAEPWQIGSFTIAKSTRTAMAQTLGLEGQQADDTLLEMALFAQEALDRNLAPADLDAKLARTAQLTAMQQLFNRDYQDLASLLPAERLRTFYAAQPALFNLPEQIQISLIFVPQGRDAFATQQMLEAKVAQLRNGAPFDALARELSTGPNAAEGGQLPLQPLSAYQAYGPKVANALPPMQVGDISDPIYCTDRFLSQNPKILRGGFAIIRMEAREPTRQRTFEEALSDVRHMYAQQHRQTLDREIRDRLLQAADFQIVRIPALKELVP